MTLTLIFTSGAPLTIARDRIAFPKLRAQVASVEATTGRKVAMANAS